MIIQVGESQSFIDCFEARTIQELNVGLSQTVALGPDEGMLFFFDDEEEQSFYMPAQMRFAIDIVLIGEDGKVTEVYEDCQPGEQDPDTGGYQKFVGPAKWVLEIPAGRAEALQIGVGTKIHFDDEEGDGVEGSTA